MTVHTPAPPDRSRIALGLGLALAGAVAWTLALPPFDLWPLIWVGFVPVVVAQHRVLPARWSGLAMAVGVGGFYAGQLSPGLADGEVAIAFQLLPVYVALLVWGLAWRSRRFHVQTGYRWLALATPIVWVAIDFLRASGNAALGGTFANPAYALWSIPGFLQPLSVFGIYGLELLILLTNWALAVGVIAFFDARRASDDPGPRVPARRAQVGIAAIAVAVVAWGALSAALLRDPEPTVTVAAVQPGKVANKAEELRHDIEQTRLAASKGAKLVVWRERGLNFEPQRRHTAELRALAAETDTYLAIGYGLQTSRGHLNEATLLAPDGRFLGRYGKDHPGTFAGDYSDTGGTFPVYRTPFGRVATIICYDLDFTDTARNMARGGARLVATPSSDVPTIAEVHYTHLVFRAIENRLTMVKADSRFDSAVIDPYGRVLAKAVDRDGRKRATLVVAVPLGSGQSLAVSWGDWIGWVCVAGTAAFLALGWRSRREARTAANAAQ